MSQKACRLFSCIGMLALILPLFVTPAQAAPGITAERIDDYLAGKGSPLAGQGIHLINSGRTRNLDPRLLVAIAGAESSFGLRTCAEYNAWNWFYANTSRCSDNSFASWAEGIEAVASGLRRLYIDQGRTTIATIAEIYTATEREIWIRNVTSFYHDELGGDLDDLTFVEPGSDADSDSREGVPECPALIAPTFPAPSARRGGMDGFGIGSSTHLRVGADRLPGTLDSLQALGVRWIREEIPWREVEASAGVFRWQYDFEHGSRPRDFPLLLAELQKRDLQMVAVLAYDPVDNPVLAPEQLLVRWQGYVRAVVEQFGKQIDHWEIGNEMNSRFMWGKVVNEPDAPAEPDPALYARMLRIAHDVIKQHDPADVVILGGLAGVVDDLDDCATNYFSYLGELQAAGVWDAFDVIAIHPYRESHPPEAFIDRGVLYSSALNLCLAGQTARYNLVSEVRAVEQVAERFGSKPIWVTELGWEQSWLETWADYRNTDPDRVEADYLVRSYVPLVAEPGLEKVFWYTHCDDSGAGRFRLDPACQRALALVASLLTGSKPLGQFQGQEDRGEAADDDVYEYRFEKDGRLIIVVWKARGGEVYRDVVLNDLEVETLLAYDLAATDLSPEAGRELTVQDGQLTLQLN